MSRWNPHQLDPKVAKRANHDHFEHDLDPKNHRIRVINTSSAKNDSYWVEVRDGAPYKCECKAHRHQGNPCKHMVHIALSQPLVDAVDTR